MTVSLDEVRLQLGAIEASEDMYAGLGPEEVPVLVGLLDDEEPWLAERALHALSRIDSDGARGAVVSAADSPRPELRVAAARAAARTGLRVQAADQILTRLLVDPEPSVRKYAVRSVSDRNSEAVRHQLSETATTENSPRLRRLAEQQISSLGT